jgi:signal transduction histidine kinase
MQLNFYFLSHLLSSVVVFIFSFLVFLKNKQSKINRGFSFFGLTICIWLLFSSFAIISTNDKIINFWFKMSYTGIILVPYTFSYFAYYFTNRKNVFISLLRWLHIIIFIPLLWLSDLLVSDVYRYPWGFYPRASLPFHFIFVLSFIALFTYAVITFILKIFSMKDDVSTIERLRAMYILLGTLFGVCGSIDFLPNYGVNFYPFGSIFTIIYPGILSYAILKYRLLDIRLLFTRAGIFILVYSLVFALPIWLGSATGLWLWSVLLMGILSPIGIFTYSYLRQQIENVIFKEQQRYQKSIRELAKRMIQIRELDKLLVEVVAEVYSAVQPQFIALYTFSTSEKAYILSRHHLPKGYSFDKQISLNSQLVVMLSKNKRPILAESAGYSNLPLETLVVPFLGEGGLFGFLILGQKATKMMYLDSDFIVFDILSAQVSLAVENCLFWQEEKTRLAREEQIRRQRAMDHFSASLAHEIDNPVFAVSGIAEMVKMEITENLKSNIPQDRLTYLDDRLSRITGDLSRISKMIKAVREFSSQTKGEQAEMKLEEVLEGFLSIVEPQFKYEGILFEKRIEPDIRLKANKIHLEEVLVNLATNAIHAVKNNNQKEKRIILKANSNSAQTFTIEFKDNGYGIKPELLEDIFLDFVTTKASTEGSGIGLGRVRKIIESHDGKVWAASEGEGKGAAFLIELPRAR